MHGFVPGGEPIPAYRLLKNEGGNADRSFWRVAAPDGTSRLWVCFSLQGSAVDAALAILAVHLQCAHEGIFPLENFWFLNGGPALVLQFRYPWRTLSEALTEAGRSNVPLEVEGLLECLVQVAEALDRVDATLASHHATWRLILPRSIRAEDLVRVDADDGSHGCMLSLIGYGPDRNVPGWESLTATAAGAAIGLADHQSALASLFVDARLAGQVSADQFERWRSNQETPELWLELLADAERPILRKALDPDSRRRFPSCTAFIEELCLAYDPGWRMPILEPAVAIRAPAAEVRPITLTRVWHASPTFPFWSTQSVGSDLPVPSFLSLDAPEPDELG